MNEFATRLKKIMFLKGIKQIALAEKIGVNKGNVSRWMNGENVPYGENLTKLAAALGVSVDYLLGEEEISLAKLTIPEFKEVPIIGKVAAGVPISAQEDIVGTVMTEKNVFALRIKGDSMSPRIMDGDVVLVKRQDSAEDGDIVIALVDGEATCKVLKRSHGSVMLVPFNAAFAPFVYTGQEAEDLRILGKVVESRHEW